MNFDFAEILNEIGPDAAFEIANEARPTADYLFETLLPESNQPDYNVESGSMTIRSTMAGIVGMDSPYPPGGVVEISTFLEKTAKIANDIKLPEATLRRLQGILRQLMLDGGGTTDFLVTEVLNFYNKVVLQAHLDRAEWMRAEALVTGAIDWTFNQINLKVDYGVPAANFLAQRTGTDAWDSTTSKFWEDIRLLQSVLKYNARAFIIHPDTLLAILNNDANKAEIIRQETFGATGAAYTLRRLIGDNERPATDFRDTVSLITYGAEAELLDLTNPGQTTLVTFMPQKKILAVGNNTRSGYRVGEGSTSDPNADNALGYTHIAPTVEGGGRPGRWGQLYVPENMPMQLHGRAVSNMLPVIEAPNKIAVASSQIGGS